MALDGIVISNVVSELSQTLTGGRINKIAQPEKDELLLTIKCNREQLKLLISSGASLPLVYLTKKTKPSPMTAPNFCMLLRKHLNSAKIISITQPGLERIIDIEIEHLNELGDTCTKHLMIELMGKHSNIIFIDDENKIVDSIKHISGLISSVRQVLPGRDYFIPHTQDKYNPLTLTYDIFKQTVLTKPMTLQKAIYMSLTGFSPLAANEICYRASLDGDQVTDSIREPEGLHLYKNLERFLEDIKNKSYDPQIVFRGEEPLEFSSCNLTLYDTFASSRVDTASSDGIKTISITKTRFASISEVLETYYGTKNVITRIRQKSTDLRKVVTNALERARKKYELQIKQLKDTEKRENFKIYGELLNTYGYESKEGSKQFTCLNYYTNEPISIPLDETKTAIENAKKYFQKYNKLKRTYEAVTVQIADTKEEIEHLESIYTSLDIALQEEDLIELKEELMEYGYIKRKFTQGKGNKKVKITSKPFHYISSDGYDIYVGKNNFQNDELTFKFAAGGDWWFHAKGIAGSHVIVKTKNGEDLPDKTFEEAGMLAAFYSKAKSMDKVEIDYTEKKNVKKPSGGKPGFVVYYTNYSLVAKPDISHLICQERI